MSTYYGHKRLDDGNDATRLPPSIYLWIVPSEHMLDQPGSWRIRKWDTEPFPEATHTASTQSSAATDITTTPLPDTADEERVRDLAQRMIGYWDGPTEMLVGFLRLLLRNQSATVDSKDAARYRFLREPRRMHLITVEQWGNVRSTLHSEALDKAVDEAMKATASTRCQKCDGRGWVASRGEQETGWHREKCECVKGNDGDSIREPK